MLVPQPIRGQDRSHGPMRPQQWVISNSAVCRTFLTLVANINTELGGAYYLLSLPLVCTVNISYQDNQAVLGRHLPLLTWITMNFRLYLLELSRKYLIILSTQSPSNCQTWVLTADSHLINGRSTNCLHANKNGKH